MSDPTPAIAHPAATVVLLRDVAHGCEVLLVQRNVRLAFHGGAWVFPGGRIDAGDYAAAGSPEPVAAARYAAAREAREEAGVGVAPQPLVAFARWLTPENVAKRFDTWFFAGAASSDDVRVDGNEIHAHQWMRPIDALAAQHRSEIELPPPTFVTLTQFADDATVAQALTRLAQQPFEFFVPLLHFVPEGACTLYHGDVAYGAEGLDRPGPRHRLWMLESGWRYERSDSSQQSFGRS